MKTKKQKGYWIFVIVGVTMVGLVFGLAIALDFLFIIGMLHLISWFFKPDEKKEKENNEFKLMQDLSR